MSSSTAGGIDADPAEGDWRARAAGESFITETVFSHPSAVGLLVDAAALGYVVHFHVILVPVELSVQRVADRVGRSGHAVPEAKIRARYDRLWGLVVAGIRIADVTEVVDNSSARAPFRLCATYLRDTLGSDAAWPVWVPSQLLERPRSRKQA